MLLEVFETPISSLRRKRFTAKLKKRRSCRICTDEAEAPELESGGFVYSPNDPIYDYSPPTCFRRGSNSRPQTYKICALSLSYESFDPYRF